MRVFNALNGTEVKEIILAEIRKAMEGDEQFQKHLTYPKVIWEWKLRVEAHPSQPSEFSQEAQGEVAVRPAEPEVVVFQGHRTVTKSTAEPEAEAPDEARTAAGLPVPTPVKTSGGWAEQPVMAPNGDPPPAGTSAFTAALRKRIAGGSGLPGPTPAAKE